MEILDLTSMAWDEHIWCIPHVVYNGLVKKISATGKPTFTPHFTAVMYNAKLDGTAFGDHHGFFLAKSEESDARMFLKAIGVKLPTLIADLGATFKLIDEHCSKKRPHVRITYNKSTKGHYKIDKIEPYEGTVRVPAIYHAIPDNIVTGKKRKETEHAEDKKTG